MAAVIGRSRAQQERFSWRPVSAAEESESPEVSHCRHRLHVLDELGHQLYDRVRYVRDSLVCLLLAVLTMLGCSLAIGLGAVDMRFNWIALALFVLGVVIMMLGIVKAIQELRIALHPLLFEHEMMERRHHTPAEGKKRASKGRDAGLRQARALDVGELPFPANQTLYRESFSSQAFTPGNQAKPFVSLTFSPLRGEIEASSSSCPRHECLG